MQMLKITVKGSGFSVSSEPYCEVSQVNPLRWRVCLKEGDNLVPQSDWWKCKDFLNDVIIHLRTGKVFGIYGFKNNHKINEEGGYMALKEVHQAFEDNLVLLNGYLKKKEFPTIEVVPHDGKEDGTEKVVLIPSLYWQNTFYISFITAAIRACCFNKHTDVIKMMNDEEKFQGGWFAKVDKYLDRKYTDKMNELMYLNYQYSSKTGFDHTHCIHNAGIQSWISSLETPANKGLLST
jgi:hypothetical protein